MTKDFLLITPSRPITYIKRDTLHVQKYQMPSLSRLQKQEHKIGTMSHQLRAKCQAVLLRHLGSKFWIIWKVNLHEICADDKHDPCK